MPTTEDISKDQTQKSGESCGGTTLSSSEATPQQQLAGQRDFKEACFVLRTELEMLKNKILLLKSHPVFDRSNPIDQPHIFGEMKANIMLTYRHAEDARMRLGKAIQSYDGGQSCYPR